MQYWGKLLGLILGLMSGIGFWGILLGLFIGHTVDKACNMRRRGFFADQQTRQSLFFRCTFQVMGHLSKAKGRVTEVDIQLANQLMERMHLHGSARIAAQQAFREGKQQHFPLRAKLKELRNMCFGHFDLIRMFLEIQFQAAFADGSLHPNERQVLYVIAEELGISRTQFDQFISMMEGGRQFGSKENWQGYAGGNQQGSFKQTTQVPTLADACKVLGVKPSDDSVVIKRAYRKLMSEHHPDKLLAKGLPPEMMEMAKEKTQEIQAAYDLIKRQLGFR
ncbi:co-chaperone DjlA [Candidatus Fukatsuia symbiotica]|uniref:Co-chaperone protein DjlA n=1 Tax=Candidatus Fukatsuia symbiotica TaxID=1878942 RepID=A0A2U8I3T2_9GAMM|nr:co-chaperone DjlA [Candidatus Fukatsuia symbiotica]AWK13796.1 molecular chaperone DjlA [Candidatus Fukatsuia symbiotica]MEA9445986.1 co-chaperone DjlA [Candidatus Fukatsuia symbiotica]